ncbi:unnamed protein product [Calicophoron daubneyi]|uniref:Uncharacterized protein n=1 Tax=Calicophoron daubneyi TaxID=300641 RepID=A0AAV2TW45_CALDB
MGKVYCAVCHKRCKGDVLKVEKQFLHHKCFQCTKCRKNLQQGGFFVRDERFYCPNDYQTEFGVKCEACHAYVEGEVVTVLGKTFHIDCFRCTGCRRLFSSGERTTIVGGRYYCTSCAAYATNGQSAHPAAADSSLHASLMSDAPGATNGEVAGDKVHPTAVSKSSQNPPLIGDPIKSLPQPDVDTGAQPDLDTALDRHYPTVNGQLTVQIHENGYISSEEDKRKTEVSSIILGPSGDPGTVDTILSTTPGQTFSGESINFSGSERRVCPPGVDYGRQYPISYLQLAERGFTAMMSSDDFTLHSHNVRTGRSRSVARTGYQTPIGTEHQSRRDGASVVSRVRPVETDVYHANDSVPLVPRADSSMTADETFRAHTMNTTVSSSWDPAGSRTPASLSGRPKRDLYVRRRELSPGSASLGSGVIGFRSWSVHPVPSTLPPTYRVPTSPYSSRSTPNVRPKRGMTMLAESLVRPRPRPDRSLSPDSAAEYWAEARRLACYPNARLPDSSSLPAIERYDFPAPPSPAVVMIDKRREKRMSAKRPTEDVTDGTQRNGTSSDAEETQMTSALENSDLPRHVRAKLHQIDAEIETLKRLGESSGITSALIQELEASKLVHVRGPDLDPVSASRSPNADIEPSYKTRYERHVFASPSRDTRRDRRPGHCLSYRMEYSSTGGRSGTVPSFPPTPRPGYTSGTLYGRAVSLPRPTMMGANGDIGHDMVSCATPVPTAASGVRTSASANLRMSGPLHGLRPTERLLYTAGGGGAVDGTDHTVTTDESLLTTLGHEGIGSLATSALSVDGLTVCSGDDTITVGAPGSGVGMKSGTITGLPHSVTGLRPVSAMLKQRSLATAHHRSHTQTPMRHAGGGAYIVTGEPEVIDMDAYPSVQSWLRPSSSTAHRDITAFKIYPYEQLKKPASESLKGVDCSRLEEYLDPSEFESLFSMPPTAFRRLPEWKRNDLKKKLDLL